MGRIYQDASITIGATGPTDGTGGCFIPRSPTWPHIPLLYQVNGSSALGELIYVTLFPDCPARTRFFSSSSFLSSACNFTNVVN